jgi:hypothetical protein
MLTLCHARDLLLELELGTQRVAARAELVLLDPPQLLAVLDERHRLDLELGQRLECLPSAPPLP